MQSALRIRPPAVAGMFYPGNHATLGAAVHALLTDIPPTSGTPPKALIVPHAGYIYSGPVAATAYAQLMPVEAAIHRVVLLGPVHRVPVHGLALPDVDAFDTPLGRIPLDKAICDKLKTLPQVCVSTAAHAEEHSLEVHLPFLQTILEDFTLVPLAVGNASAEDVAGVLEAAWGGDETLIVVSSDLSHYMPYSAAQALDAETCQRVLAFDTHIGHTEACGATPIRGLLKAAQRHGLQPRLLDLRNSGDTAGDKMRVVGYASFAFSPAPEEPVIPDADDGELGHALLTNARHAIATRLGLPAPDLVDLPALRKPGASFVTLTLGGALRGCVGGLQARRPLGEDVFEHALAAAFSDPRFPPVEAEEWPHLAVEVSLLSPAWPMQFTDEDDALMQLRPGIDGVILDYQGHRATFLPQVWEQLPSPADFLSQLKRKAGLPGDFWSSAIALSRYSVQKWHAEPNHG